MNPSPGPAPVPAEQTLPAPAGTEPLLKLRGISKHFGPVQALFEVDLDIPSGQVTALCGDNGAGKSVLTKTIAGIHQADAGQMFWEGRLVHIRSPRDSAALGIETVYQDLALADNLDIVQNMFLGRERLNRFFLNEDGMERAAAVAVAKAVMWNSKLVMLDEPTAALGVAQTRMVLDLIKRLKDHGLAVMVISHNLNDVFEVADRIAILHLGRMVAQAKASTFDRQSAVDFMTTGGSSREVASSGSTQGRN